jgi:hypothetical protein
MDRLCGQCRVHVRAAFECAYLLETSRSGIDLGLTMHEYHWDAVGNECVLRQLGQDDYLADVLKRECNLGHTKKAPYCRRSDDRSTGSSVVVVISFSASHCCAAATRSKRRSPGNSIGFIGFGRQKFEGFRALY